MATAVECKHLWARGKTDEVQTEYICMHCGMLQNVPTSFIDDSYETQVVERNERRRTKKDIKSSKSSKTRAH